MAMENHTCSIGNNRKYIFKWYMFHCHVCLLESKQKMICKPELSSEFGWFRLFSWTTRGWGWPRSTFETIPVNSNSNEDISIKLLSASWIVEWLFIDHMLLWPSQLRFTDNWCVSVFIEISCNRGCLCKYVFLLRYIYKSTNANTV